MKIVRRHVWRRVAAAGFAWLALPGALFAADAGYRLGIFPYMAPRQTIEFFGPVAASMELALGRPVKLESVPSFGDFTAAMARQRYDIALIQPFDYPKIVQELGYIPLAQMAVPLVSQLFVRSDSPYQHIADLRGTIVAMPPAEAANARMTLRALHDNHLVPGRDVEIRYFNSHDSCIQQVWIGSASACGTAQPPVTVFQERMRASLRPIYSTPPIPHIVYVVHPRVPAQDRARLTQLITGWTQTEEGRVLLKNLGFPGFVPARPAEYAMMRGYDPAAGTAQAQVKPRKELMLGIFPYFSARQLTEHYGPALPALSRAAATRVHFKTASNFGGFMDNVAAGSYDLVLVQPFDYAKAVRAGYLPLAAMKDPLGGNFFVREESRFHSLEDFRGQTIATGPAESAQARLTRHALFHAGLTPGRDLTVTYRATHDSCMREVQRGKAAACATSPLVLSMLPPELTKDLRAVGETHTVPGVVFLAHQRVPPPVRDQLGAEIMSWNDSPAGREILKSIGFGEFGPVNKASYEQLPSLEVKN